MESRKENRSVQRTRALLKKGIVELMQQKPLSKITVRELTDYVNLNRGTFYLHYRDINDLLDQMEDETLSNMRTILDSHMLQEVADSPYSLIRDVFHLLTENADFCRVLLSDNTRDSFLRKLEGLVRDKLYTDWLKVPEEKKPENFDLFYAFVIAGIIGILESWFYDGMRQPVDEVAAIAERFILHGMDAL